jgi:segregation and condensation protein B
MPKTDETDRLPLMEPHMAPELTGVRPEELRIAEALVFASREPLSVRDIARHLPPGTDVAAVMARLQAEYANGGINVVKVGERWAARTAGDLAFAVARQVERDVDRGKLPKPPRKLSKAATETLALIAYDQPITRAEIDAFRGTTATSLDVLLELGWIRPRGRRRSPGRPLTYGTSPAFLDHFGLASLADLPVLRDVAAFELDIEAFATVADGHSPSTTLREEDPLDQADLDLTLAGKMPPEEIP